MEDLFTIIDNAAQAAADHTPEADLAQLQATLQTLIDSREPFTSMAIWTEHPDIRSRIETRALGSLFLKASKAGLITKLGIVPSTDRISHGRDTALWIAT